MWQPDSIALAEITQAIDYPGSWNQGAGLLSSGEYVEEPVFNPTFDDITLDILNHTQTENSGSVTPVMSSFDVSVGEQVDRLAANTLDQGGLDGLQLACNNVNNNEMDVLATLVDLDLFPGVGHGEMSTISTPVTIMTTTVSKLEAIGCEEMEVIGRLAPKTYINHVISDVGADDLSQDARRIAKLITMTEFPTFETLCKKMKATFKKASGEGNHNYLSGQKEPVNVPGFLTDDAKKYGAKKVPNKPTWKQPIDLWWHIYKTTLSNGLSEEASCAKAFCMVICMCGTMRGDVKYRRELMYAFAMYAERVLRKLTDVTDEIQKAESLLRSLIECCDHKKGHEFISQAVHIDRLILTDIGFAPDETDDANAIGELYLSELCRLSSFLPTIDVEHLASRACRITCMALELMLDGAVEIVVGDQDTKCLQVYSNALKGEVQKCFFSLSGSSCDLAHVNSFISRLS